MKLERSLLGIVQWSHIFEFGCVGVSLGFVSRPCFHFSRRSATSLLIRVRDCFDGKDVLMASNMIGKWLLKNKSVSLPLRRAEEVVR